MMSQRGNGSHDPGNQHPDPRRRRLLFRCWHRGTQEIDLLLGSFAETFLDDFDSDQLGRFEGLLDCADVDLFDWITGRSRPPPAYDHDVMRLLRASVYRQKRG
jgi:antitoxin CptB